jgi:hypothetical protein
MSEEKGETCSVEDPSPATTQLDETLAAQQDLPDVGMPEAETSIAIVPSEKQAQVLNPSGKKRPRSEAQLKQLAEARGEKKKKNLNLQSSVSLLKEDYESYKQKMSETERQWQERLDKIHAEHNERYSALEQRLLEMTPQRMNEPQISANPYRAPVADFVPPRVERGSYPVQQRLQLPAPGAGTGGGRTYVHFG